MASYDQARNFNFAEEDKEKETFHGRVGSKAQMCIHKILHIIKTIPPPPPPPPPPPHHQDQPSSSSDASNSKRGSFDIDLNLTSCPSLLVFSGIQQNLESPAADDGGTETESTVAEKGLSNELNCDVAIGDQFCDDQKKSSMEKQENVLTRDEKGLELLMEAARVVTDGLFGGSDDEDEEQKKRPGPTESPQRNHRLQLSRFMSRTQEYIQDEEYQKIEEDAVTFSPVVRSKRGRIRVLPYKYRDSVLEPLTRLSRPSRSSTPVPTKRRSR